MTFHFIYEHITFSAAPVLTGGCGGSTFRSQLHRVHQPCMPVLSPRPNCRVSSARATTSLSSLHPWKCSAPFLEVFKARLDGALSNLV